MYWQPLNDAEASKWNKRVKKKFKGSLPSYSALNIVEHGIYQLQGRVFKWPHFICFSKTQDKHKPELQYFYTHFRFYGKKEQVNLNFSSRDTTDNLARRVQSALESPGLEKALQADLPENAPEEVRITVHQLHTWLADCLTKVKSLTI